MTQLTLERFESSSAKALLAPDPETDAEREAAEEERLQEEARRTAQIAREEAIASALAQLADTVAQSRKGAIDAVCTDFAHVLAEALPSLVAANFTGEMASAIGDLVDAAGIASASLQVSAGDENAIIEAIKRLSPEHPIAIVVSSDLADGQARIEWANGGAELDAESWGRNMQQLLSAHLEARRNEGVDK